MNFVIKNVVIFTNEEDPQLLSGQAVVVAGNSITAVGPEAELNARYADFATLDGRGRLLMPGLVNTHMHFYGTYARGLALGVQPRNFAEILAELWWKLDSVLDLDAVYYSALLPAITAVKHGVTAVIDHHASPRAIDGSLDRIEEALALVGMRGLLCYEVSDRDGKAVAQQGLQENERYIRRSRDARAANPEHPFDGMIGLHASFTLNDETLAQAADLSRATGRGAHIHLLEDGVDEVESRAKYGAGAVQRLLKHDLLNAQSIAAHAIHLDEEGLEGVVESGTIVVHNAQSNMNNAVGRADIFKLLERGVTVGLGTDGMTPDLRAEVRAGYLMHKHHLADPNAGWNQFQTMTLDHNPAIYRRLTGQQVGRIAPGYLADIILVDYFPPTPFNAGNFWGHFLYGLTDAAVDTTIINGNIVMQDKQLPHIDEAQIAAASQACAKEVWARFQI